MTLISLSLSLLINLNQALNFHSWISCGHHQQPPRVKIRVALKSLFAKHLLPPPVATVIHISHHSNSSHLLNSLSPRFLCIKLNSGRNHELHCHPSMCILAKQRLGLSAMDFDQKLQFVERRVRERLGFQAFNLMRESQSKKLMRERERGHALNFMRERKRQGFKNILRKFYK